MPHIAFLLHPRALLSGAVMPAEMFRAADEISRVRRLGHSRLRLTLATTDDRPIDGIASLQARPGCRLQELSDVDLAYLPPFWRRPDVAQAEPLAAIRRLAAGGALFCASSPRST